MADPKKHHFLPQFYLEGFKTSPVTNKYPHIWGIPKSLAPKPFCAPIKDIGCESGYHDIDTDPLNRDRRSFEGVLQRIESRQAAAIRRVLEQKFISPNDKPTLASFISTIRCRVPSFRKTFIGKFLQETVEAQARFMLRKDMFPPPPPQVKEHIEQEGFDIFRAEISNWMILHQMINAAAAPEILSMLQGMNYSLVEATRGLEFITSDSPVALYVPDYNARRPYGVGLADREVEVTIPLTKQHLLLASWDETPSFQTARFTEVLEFNRRTIIMAEKFAYASSIFDGRS